MKFVFWAIATVLALLLAVAIGGKRRRFFKLSFSVDLACVVAGICLTAYLAITNRSNETAPQTQRVHVFVVDCSRSMLADDHGATRLQRAKDLANKMLEEITDGPVALVSFAGSAFLDLPPTEDREAFRDALSQLAPSLEDLPGSDPAEALKLAET